MILISKIVFCYILKTFLKFSVQCVKYPIYNFAVGTFIHLIFENVKALQFVSMGLLN